MTTMKDGEYIESSHRSVLAREASVIVRDQTRHAIRSASRQNAENIRPCTPVPSLVNSDTMSLRSANTISPTTPNFDMSIHPASMTRSPCQIRSKQLGFDRDQPGPSMNRPLQHSDQADFDSASTYQPRRIVPVHASMYGSQQSPTSASTDETSFIEWDDDPSRFQRVKQSIKDLRPHRVNDTVHPTTKNPDKYLNAIPRLPLRTTSNSKPQSRIGTPQPVIGPPKLHIPQQQSLPSRTPVSFEQQLYRPVNTSTRTIQSTINRHSEDTGIRPAHTTIPFRRTPNQYSHNINSRTKAPSSVPSPTSTLHGPARKLSQQRGKATRPTIRHHDELDFDSTSVSTRDVTQPPTKPKRFMNMMHGVMERVSMRDLRKEANRGK